MFTHLRTNKRNDSMDLEIINSRKKNLMKTYSQFVAEAWIPPFKPKSIRGGTKSPAQVALNRAKEQGRDSAEVQNKLSNSVRKHGSAINNPQHSDIDYKHDSDTDTHTFTHKKHPIRVEYSPGNTPNTYVQHSKVSGSATDRVATGKAMQDIKKHVASAARPGTTLASQPISRRRGTLNTRSQGMSDVNDQGTQAGIARNRSPKQKANKAKPLDPINYTDSIIDH